MPYAMRKIPRKDYYSVYNRVTKRKFSKCTSRSKALKQLNLLRAIQFNKDFVVQRRTRRRRRGVFSPQK